jgi:hypothetical protein
VQTVILLGLVRLLTDISSKLVYLLLSLYLTTSLGATPAIVDVIEGIAYILFPGGTHALISYPTGRLSDRIGKRSDWCSSLLPTPGLGSVKTPTRASQDQINLNFDTKRPRRDQDTKIIAALAFFVAFREK